MTTLGLDLGGDITAAFRTNQRKWPTATLGIVAVLSAVFAVEVALSFIPALASLAPSVGTLDALGGISHSEILAHGQFWRLFTAPLLHANLTHLAGNALTLVLIGRRLENLIGGCWLAGIFASSAFAGALASLALGAPNLVGVGASGGIVGLCAAAFLLTLRLPPGKARTRLLWWSLLGLLPAVIPALNIPANGEIIDYSAHFGGAIGGGIAGVALLIAWRGPSRLPAGSAAALAATLAFAAATVLSTLAIPANYAQWSRLAPNWPSTIARMESVAAKVTQTSPLDPRAHFIAGIMLTHEHNWHGAEIELRATLADLPAVADLMNPALEHDARALLAIAYVAENEPGNARAVAPAHCDVSSHGGSYDAILVKYRLCSAG